MQAGIMAPAMSAMQGGAQRYAPQSGGLPNIPGVTRETPQTSTPNIYDTSAGAFNNAIDMTQQSTVGGPSTYEAATMGQNPHLRGRSLQGYMNPYQNQVIRRARNDLDRQRQMAVNDIGAAATAAGAFGGSRHGVAEGVTNGEFARTSADMAATLRDTGFQNAQNAARFDITNQLNRRSQNMNALNNASRFNATQQDTYRQGLRSAGSQLGQLGQLGFSLGNTTNQNMAGNGLMAQQMTQGLFNNAQRQYGGYTGAPNQGLGGMMGALSGVPYGSTTTQSYNPGIWDIISMGMVY